MHWIGARRRAVWSMRDLGSALLLRWAAHGLWPVIKEGAAVLQRRSRSTQAAHFVVGWTRLGAGLHRQQAGLGTLQTRAGAGFITFHSLIST